MASSENMGPFETVEFSKVRGLAHRFEQAWEAQQDSSQGIDLLPFLPDANDPARLPSLYELIKTDLECRWQRGLPTSLEMYVEKFPEIGPMEKIAATLIYEEYRIRTQHGSPAPLNQYKSRFPSQFAEFESLIQTMQSQMEKITSVSTGEGNADAAPPNISPLAMAGNGTLVGGHYTLNKRIGTGGFGEVWLGNDIHGNIPKAIKIITRSVESDEAKQELNALEIIKRLNHPYLLRTEGFFAEQERLIVVMELADGSLRETLKKAKKETDRGLPVEKLLVYMRHASEALDYLHEEGIFHRDIKPENILLVGKIAKVADFGLAKLAANRQSTKTNFAGTSAYSSPETWKGRVTAKSDLYSLAVTYAELRLGRTVFKGSTIYEYMIEHLQSQPNLDPMPDEEKAVVLRALAKEPTDRYASCSDFIQELQRVVAGPGSLPDIGVGMRPAPSGAGNQTPASKWNTTAASSRPGSNPSFNTQRGGLTNTAPGKSLPNWKAASRAEIDLAEPEPAQPYRRNRRRKGPNPIAIGLGLLCFLALLAGGASLFAKSLLESKSQELAVKGDITGALKTIDEGSFLAGPFKDGMRDDVLKKGLELAEKHKKNGHLKDLIDVAKELVNAFSTDGRGLTILNDALLAQIPEMVKSENFADAYRTLYSLPLNIPAKSKLLLEVAREWLEHPWQEIESPQPDYAEIKKATGDLLRIDPNHKDARALNDLVAAAESAQGDIYKGNYGRVLEKIRHIHGKGQKLADDIRGKVKTAWLNQAKDLNKNGNFDAAQKTLVEFSEYFKNDLEGTPLLKEVFNNLFEGYFAADNYEAALELLRKTNFAFPDLTERVKDKWHANEVKRFAKDDDGSKQLALQGLAKLSKQFGSDFELQADYRKYKVAFVESIFPQIDASLQAKNYRQANNLIAKAEPYGDGPQETHLKSLQLLALVDNPKTASGDRKTIETLLSHVMGHWEKATTPNLEQILKGVLKLGKDDPVLLGAVRSDLMVFRDVFPENKLPAEYWKLPGMSKTAPSANATGNRRIYDEALKLFNAKEFDKALEILQGMEIRNEVDKELCSNYYVLYAKLGENGALTREQVLSLDAVLPDVPEIKPYLPKAMTRAIERSWKAWPAGSDTWASRVKDADRAEGSQPIVKAFKAEALLEMGQNVDFALLEGKGEQKAYVDYVQARMAVKKKDSLTAPVRTLERILPSELWLAPGRRVEIGKILQLAALDLAKSPDGSRRLFESTDDAKKAYVWLEKSLQFSGKTATEGDALPWQCELTFALAAACKVPPAFALNKTLGTDLFAKHRPHLLVGDRINLVLANPVAFPDELKSLKTGLDFGVNDINGVVPLGDAQMIEAPEPDLTQRQAVLYSLKGWALERALQQDNDAIYTAYSKAASLEPDNGAYLVAKGRYGALAKLMAAAKEQDSSSKISLLNQGIKACALALSKKLVNDEWWADLCLQRSQLALELGNEFHRMNQPDGLTESFLDARAYAEKARDAKIPHKKQADVLLALGNALEDLAEFARLEPDINKNYEAAATTFDQASTLHSDYLYNAGRVRFRYAIKANPKLDEAKKKDLFNIALKKLDRTANDKKSSHAAEASHFEGYCYWYLGDLPKTFASFERCVYQVQKNENAAIWGKWSAENIAKMALLDFNNDPSRALGWLDKGELAFRPLKDNPAFEGVQQKLNDATAEVAMEVARKAAAAKDFAKFKAQSDRALQLKHSTKGQDIAVERAFLSLNYKAQLKLGSQDLAAIHAQALAAIDAMTILTDAQKQQKKSEFESLWKKKF